MEATWGSAFYRLTRTLSDSRPQSYRSEAKIVVSNGYAAGRRSPGFLPAIQPVLVGDVMCPGRGHGQKLDFHAVVSGRQIGQRNLLAVGRHLRGARQTFSPFQRYHPL